MSRRYDSRTTIFSPEGRLYQVEYAMEAIGNAGSAIGILSKDGVVLVGEKKVTSKLLQTSTSTEKMYKIDDHVACAVAGIMSDANILINTARVAAQRYTFSYQTPMPVEQLVQSLCDTKQGYTQFGGLRPFGVSFLFAGWDKNYGFQLYMSDPSVPRHPLMQQPQIHPHPQSHLHHLHLPQQQQQQQPPPNFPPHMPPHVSPSPFHGPYDAPPPPAPPPSDPEQQKTIDKLVEYAVKNGPEFEAMIREKQKDNPAYSFLFGGEGHSYYRYKLWLASHPPGAMFNPSFPPSNVNMLHTSNPMMNNQSPLNPPHLPPAPQMHQQHPYPPFYEQQHHQPFVSHGRPEFDQSSRAFKGLSGPLPSDVASEMNNMLNSLTGTKESIKGAKMWFMQRSPFAPALAEALRDRVFSLDDSERQLHIIYLANDILFDSLQRRVNPHEIDNEALAFRHVLGSMLARIYHNPVNKDENQSRLQKILQFWASKEVYDPDTIRVLETEMLSGPPVGSFPKNDLSTIPGDPSAIPGHPQQASASNMVHWQPDKQGMIPNLSDQEQLPPGMAPPIPTPQFHSNPGYPSSIPLQSSIQQIPPQEAPEKLPPYPLFPPGLIPGMVRKMQIGSGVPYSPMSPLDIPTVIPPSTISPSEILESVSKFFKEIGEVNPSEGPMGAKSDDEDEYEYERETPVRKGGACIPPPPNLQVDPETGTYADGTVEKKPGSSGSGRLGLGATANPNEVSQYDDVYTSYRKQRSTNYHSSMSARASTR